MQAGPIYWRYISTFIVQKQKKKRCSDSQVILEEELHCHALPRKAQMPLVEEPAREGEAQKKVKVKGNAKMSCICKFLFLVGS